jgi:hypothetical protein
MSNNTWTGYKAVLSSGIYSFEETVTEGLTFGEYMTPAVGYIYDYNCTCKLDIMYMPVTLDFNATSYITNKVDIPASFRKSGSSDLEDCYVPYRVSTSNDRWIRTGDTINKKSWNRVLFNNPAHLFKPITINVYVHGYTELNDVSTITAIHVEGSNDLITWDELGGLEGVRSSGEWIIPCSANKSYKSLRLVFTNAVEGPGGVLWKVLYNGVLENHGEPTASPYNPESLEHNGYKITASYSFWEEFNEGEWDKEEEYWRWGEGEIDYTPSWVKRPWMAFCFNKNQNGWGGNTTDGGVGQWLAWESNTPKCIKRYQLQNGFDNINQAVDLQGYDESSGEWITIDSIVSSKYDGVTMHTCPDNNRSFKKHRLICTSIGEGAHPQFSNIAAWE